MKDKKKDRAKSVSDVPNEISGHVAGYSLGHDLVFQIRTKRGKDVMCRVLTSHALFDALADSIAHAHWADRKIHVSVVLGDTGFLSVNTLQIGDLAKAETPEAEKEAAAF